MNLGGARAAAVAAALLANPLYADRVTCNDGRVFSGVIEGRSETGVTINIGGAGLLLPRTEIRSIDISSPEANASIRERWKNLNLRYQEESRDAEAEAEAAPPPPPAPAAPPPVPSEEDLYAAEEEEPEAIEAVEAPSPAPLPTWVQQRIEWKQTVNRNIRAKRVVPGMTQREVRRAWGWPDLTHPVHGVSTYTDRWIYQRENESRANVYFLNGVAVGVDE